MYSSISSPDFDADGIVDDALCTLQLKSAPGKDLLVNMCIQP